jgi:hypothetical protein
LRVLDLCKPDATRNRTRWRFIRPPGGKTMQAAATLDGGVHVDPIEEMRLRTWARQHYAPHTERDNQWHPVILDEMRRKDSERS